MSETNEECVFVRSTALELITKEDLPPIIHALTKECPESIKEQGIYKFTFQVHKIQ
jgi:hypothetical protein